MTNKISKEQLEKLKSILLVNHVNKVKMKDEVVAEQVGMHRGMVSYYKGKWGFSKKQKHPMKNKQPKTEYLPKTGMSLAQAIFVCKKNGLRVIREKMVTEEL